MAKTLSTLPSTKTSHKDESYRVPTTGGGFISADPIKFCLRFRPPTIAIVYQLLAKSRKYVHEFVIDMKEGADLSVLCD
jgi:hypothetical protein